MSIVFTEDLKFSKNGYELCAKSFNKWIKSTNKTLGLDIKRNQTIVIREKDENNTQIELQYRKIPTHYMRSYWGSGKLHKCRTCLAIYNSSQQSTICFDNTVHIPVLGEYKYGDWMPWMSLAPMEVMTQRRGIKLAKGNVLIGGLGMGWLTAKVALKDKVESVTVVEKIKETAEYFGNKIMKLYPKVKIVQGDVYEYLSKHQDKYNSILMDIWPQLSDKFDDQKFLELKDSRKNVWGWGHRIYKSGGFW